MRDDFYLRAAKLIATGKQSACCLAIHALNEDAGDFASYFGPSPTNADNQHGCFFMRCRNELTGVTITRKEMQGRRILALCFMSAIAADEERSTRRRKC